MIVIPAIDLKDGRCVRLRQGRMDSSTVFNEDPVAQALLWEGLGASRIHVVDLDGSVEAKPANFRKITQIVSEVRVPVQVGGGIRDEATIRRFLDTGVSTLILGTLPVKDPDDTMRLLSIFPGRLAIGIDARGGEVAVEGWTQATTMQATDLAARFDKAGAAAFIFTDIERDGMMRGPNIAATRAFAGSVSTPVILSGGVSTLADVKDALPLAKDGVMGIIIGRALYEGQIDLAAAIELAREEDASKEDHTLP